MKTIEEIRLIRLNVLKKELGSIAAISRKTGISYSQLSQWFNQSPDSKTGKPRTLQSSSARLIEKSCGKEKGWLDNLVHEIGNKKIAEVVDILKQLDENELMQYAIIADALLKQKKQIDYHK